jgi:peptide-methionine (R)-S-oxide reductase
MMSRRNALLAGIGLAGVAASLYARFALGAHAGAEKFEVSKTEAEWKQVLTPEQFQVLRQRGTERPYSSALDNEHRPGMFACAACDLPLFRSETKFDSGTGWPSFFAPIEDAVRTSNDYSLIIPRTEVHCRRLRRSSRPRVRRRAQADWEALLHEWSRPEIPAGRLYRAHSLHGVSTGVRLGLINRGSGLL